MVSTGRIAIKIIHIQLNLLMPLTEAGYLSALIPEEYGGLGLSLSVGVAILEEIHKSGCNAAACHAQMYTMLSLIHI